MSSYSSPLPPYVTAGWNDPPANLGSERKVTGSRILTHKFRRPVDPSIQSTGFTAQPAQLATYQPPNGYGQVPNPAQQISIAPASVGAMSFQGASGNAQPPANTYHHPQQQKSFEHRAVYDAFTIPSASNQHPHDFAQIRPSTCGSGAPVPMPTGGIPLQQNFTSESNTTSFCQQPPLSTVSYSSPPPVGPPIESNPNALIYTPPNVIGEHQQRPATSPDPASYVAPMKAAGDVSLSGAQLVQFLTKATLRLPQGVTREGIQLRIGQFHDLIKSNGVSEGCIKKLNFVVDALDRGVYEDAMEFFEQMQSLFPEETKTSWAQGVRLLIQELRRPVRGGSAGPMGHR